MERSRRDLAAVPVEVTFQHWPSFNWPPFECSQIPKFLASDVIGGLRVVGGRVEASTIRRCMCHKSMLSAGPIR